jgi:hypothetical protein
VTLLWIIAGLAGIAALFWGAETFATSLTCGPEKIQRQDSTPNFRPHSKDQPHKSAAGVSRDPGAVML